VHRDPSKEGLAGLNLFVYHTPPSWGDNELAAASARSVEIVCDGPVEDVFDGPGGQKHINREKSHQEMSEMAEGVESADDGEGGGGAPSISRGLDFLHSLPREAPPPGAARAGSPLAAGTGEGLARQQIRKSPLYSDFM
jgi:hypothetical protein